MPNRVGRAKSDRRAEPTKKILACIYENSNVIEGFGVSVESILTKNIQIQSLIHSFKRRRKSDESIEEKIRKKRRAGEEINSANVCQKITDLYAVRLIHLYPQDIVSIHKAILQHAANKDWVLVEKPKAYTWDPESEAMLKRLGLGCETKPSYYTSVHYLVSPRKDAVAVCEIQVRSLLEEVWGEVDHRAKYKKGAPEPRISEHLAVLARLIGAGSKLVSALAVDLPAKSKGATPR